jgi:DNA-binding LacI/PurR family transcriptional regulator
MVTLQDVARAAKVSVATVSKALSADAENYRISKECRERVAAVCRELGYQPNFLGRSLRAGKSTAIGSLMGSYMHAYENVPLWSLLHAGMTSAALEHDYQLVILGARSAADAVERGLLALHERRIDGLLVPTHLCNAQVVKKLSAIRAPIVLAAWYGQNPLPTIEIDDNVGTQQVIDHLCDLGHRRFLWVASGDEHDLYESRRHKAFRDGLARRGLTPERFAVGFDHKLLMFKEDQIEVTRMKLLAQGRDLLRRATAVVAYNEPVALGVYAAAAALNLSIPRELSVASFDDLYANVAYPTMTVVNQKLFEVGVKVVEVLLEMIAHPTAWKRLRATRFKVSPELVVRRSTAPPPDASLGEAST